jgi:prepilin-type processing-associated H-X9-DG protein
LELLVVMAVVGMLAALILPAVSSAREAARRTQCVNQLKQIGLALHTYHDQHHCLPIGWQWEATGQSAYGWAVPLLPLLDERPLSTCTSRDRLLDDPVNSIARRSALAVFLCPSDITTPNFTLYGGTGATSATPAAIALLELPTANYVGVFGTTEADDGIPAPLGEGTFLENRSVRFAELQRGLSNTIIVGERTMARVPSTWLGIHVQGEDAACRLVGSAASSPNCELCDECEFDSRHPGGANFLRGDGGVSLLSENIDSHEYRRLAQRSDF